jgi:hypothetical protein
VVHAHADHASLAQSGAANLGVARAVGLRRMIDAEVETWTRWRDATNAPDGEPAVQTCTREVITESGVGMSVRNMAKEDFDASHGIAFDIRLSALRTPAASNAESRVTGSFGGVTVS